MSAGRRIGVVVEGLPQNTDDGLLQTLDALSRLNEIHVVSVTPGPANTKEQPRQPGFPIYQLPDNVSAVQQQLRAFDPANGVGRLRQLNDWLMDNDCERQDARLKRDSTAACISLHHQGALLASLGAIHQLDHFHAFNAGKAATVAMLASRLSGKPFSLTAPDEDIRRAYDHPEPARNQLLGILQESTFAVTHSKTAHQYLRTVAPAIIAHHIYPGLDLKTMKASSSFPKSDLIVAIGQDAPGLTSLMDACQTLQRKKVDFRCILIDLRQTPSVLEKQISQRKLSGISILRDPLSSEELTSWIQRVSIVIPPLNSHRPTENLDIIARSLALGTPVIATSANDPDGIVEHLVHGWRIDAQDHDALASALEQSLRLEAKAQRRMAANTRRRAENLFDLQNNSRSLNALFATTPPRTPHDIGRNH